MRTTGESRRHDRTAASGRRRLRRRRRTHGVDSLWVPEVWGYDALTGLAYLAARTSSIKLGTFVVQLGSRSPALLATSALSLQELSGRPVPIGDRHVGTAGDGGLARRAVP